MRNVLIATLMLLCGSAQAEWLFVGGSDRVDYYIEMKTIQKTGDRRQVLELLDLKSPDVRGNRSYLALYEYDCPTQRARILRSACFDGPMGGGQKTHEQSVPGDWLPTSPGSAGMAQITLVCGE